MVRRRMMLGNVVAEVFLSWVPLYVELSLFDLVNDPEVAHVHCAGALFFDGVVGDAGGCCIVDVYGRRWLRVSHFVKGKAHDFALFRVEKERRQFRFGG